MRKEVALSPRERPTHGHVEDDEEAVVGGVGPRVGRYLVRMDRSVVHIIEVKAKLIRLDTLIELDRIGVGGVLQRRLVYAPADAIELVARASRRDAAMQ